MGGSGAGWPLAPVGHGHLSPLDTSAPPWDAGAGLSPGSPSISCWDGHPDVTEMCRVSGTLGGCGWSGCPGSISVCLQAPGGRHCSFPPSLSRTFVTLSHSHTHNKKIVGLCMFSFLCSRCRIFVLVFGLLRVQQLATHFICFYQKALRQVSFLFFLCNVCTLCSY